MFDTGKSPTRKALVTCVENSYTAGQTLDEAQQTPAGHLETVLGLYPGLADNAAACATAIDDIAKSEPAGSNVLTVDDLARTTTKPWYRQRVNVHIEQALKVVKVIAG